MERERATGRRYPIHDVKVLWGLSAGRCAFPDCREICIEPAVQQDGPAVIGDIAHIIAHASNGPRATSEFPKDQLDTYGNWVILCATHHRLVDAQPATYTAEMLRHWKERHEAWVVERLGVGLGRSMFRPPQPTEVELFRIAWAGVDPWHPPAPTGPLDRRWDAPDSSYRVTYAASSAELAFADAFREAPAVARRDVADRVVSSAAVKGRFADLIRDAMLRRSLNERLAVLFGPVSASQLSRSADYRRTQEMSRMIFAEGTYDGVVYPSAVAPLTQGSLYALFDSSEASDVRVWPLLEYPGRSDFHLS